LGVERGLELGLALALRDHDRGNRGCMNEFWIATFFIFKDRSITKLVTETLKNNVKV
jgi:hypothetical protein